MKKIIAIFVSIIFLTVISALIFFDKNNAKIAYKDDVFCYSTKYNLSPALVFAIIKVESDFNKDAKSSSGAIGLMQIMPQTAKYIASMLGEEIESSDLFIPTVNIRYGCFYLNYLNEKYDDPDEVILAYNMGETCLNELKLQEDYDKLNVKIEESRNYLKRVKKFIKKYKKYAR